MNKNELSQILYALIKTYGKKKAIVLFENLIKTIVS
jgi:hypothetical protein